MWTALISAALLAYSASAARWGLGVSERSGRQLLDISVNATSANSNFALQVFPLSNFNSSSQCIIQGFPGSRADSVVPGPLVVNVPVGTTSVISFGQLTDNAIVALYNQTANNTLATSYNASYGLATVTFIANDSSLIGKSAYITGGRLDNYNGNISTWGNAPSCLVNITFVVVAPPPPPPPPSPPPPSFPGFVLPKNPCYCTPVVNGYTTCFNFNQAGSDINCAPNSSYQCTSATAGAGIFTQQAGPVFNCQTSTATAG